MVCGIWNFFGTSIYWTAAILTAWIIVFGLAIVVLAFCIPTIISANMPFLFFNLGKGLFFTFVACLVGGANYAGMAHSGLFNCDTRNDWCNRSNFFYIVFLYVFILGCVYLFFAILEACNQPCAPQPRPVFINGCSCGGQAYGTGYHQRTVTTTHTTRSQNPPPRTKNPMRAGKQLPPGWSSAKDPTTNRVYYINNRTGRTQWDPPR